MAIGFGMVLRLLRGAGGKALSTRDAAGAEVLPWAVRHGLALSPVFLLSLFARSDCWAFWLALRIGLDCRAIFEKSPICEYWIHIMGFDVFLG
ncbi:hypothetical protein [Paraburkholderia ultramafica]|uniref:hypothetical protein n=1 Tax=Paraburkholderia ultramafica TaxID=1544867 RepID=UPI001581CEB2|nr:hypothetical protein [Paraburkholderia ultramafica]